MRIRIVKKFNDSRARIYTGSASAIRGERHIAAIQDPGASTARLSSSEWKTADHLSASRPTERKGRRTVRERGRDVDKVNAD